MEQPGPDVAVYVISVAAQLTGLHPQTLRTYERMGLITPGRTGGGGRRYSGHDIALLREISELTSSGIGIEGVRRILQLEDQVAALTARIDDLQAELDAAHEAERAARSARRTAQVPQTTNRLPVPWGPTAGRSLVVWRRGL